ncbi:uncharacterized protein LOC134774459 [Penaeus indicus]|uniref:uncharacterized protein LOC134774459 n=1 Tax=Penaeus indicus TaxID=29960 RepID=UPI00300CE61E
MLAENKQKNLETLGKNLKMKERWNPLSVAYISVKRCLCSVDTTSKCLILAVTRNAFVPRVSARRAASAQAANARLAARVPPRRSARRDARSHAAVVHRRDSTTAFRMTKQQKYLFFYLSYVMTELLECV